MQYPEQFDTFFLLTTDKEQNPRQMNKETHEKYINSQGNEIGVKGIKSWFQIPISPTENLWKLITVPIPSTCTHYKFQPRNSDSGFERPSTHL